MIGKYLPIQSGQIVAIAEFVYYLTYSIIIRYVKNQLFGIKFVL